ncbi:AfsR/SARP family transcriptional regulator [Streptomyces sp. S07_1.15]|uniref:AfsR/SARP family transcriptional regulator n=1 Tax=Streptomyces sp. S07_1.15 TaxID=2873925 RepID=UPI001D146E79|nr:AfsR/SARP family transcriptional regulator [Streptomyces sp. S07_1.15]MCC3650613.1 AfsR/SARP family transcriptional regulator [Streptomyces sp. S07_1.15]
MTPSAPQLRQVLALLVLRRGEVVSTDALGDEVWGAHPPRRALRALHTSLYELRRTLAPEPSGTAPWVVTRPGGYMAVLPEEAVDVGRFQALVAHGRREAEEGRPGVARRLLGRGLALWRGAALSGVRCGEVLGVHAAGLEEARLRALELRIDTDLELGHHGQVVAELTELAAGRPFHEGLAARLMLALYRAGRRGEALAAYQDLRRRLGAELGAEPGPQVQRLHHAVLRDEAGLPAEEGPARTRVRPAELPPDVSGFTGRAGVLAGVTGLAASGRRRGAVPVVCLVGMPGVGKTATAVHAAHLLREHYPDGQFHVPLGDVPGDADDGSAALGRMLRATGMAPEAVPGTAQERTAAFRSWSSGRRVLVVLDGAVSARQVEPLLPAGPGSVALVTTCCALYGLRAHTAVRLGAFTPGEAVEALGRAVGHGRLKAEPAAAVRIAECLGRLPLAVTAAGARLAGHPTARLSLCADLLERCAEEHRLSDLARLGLDLDDRIDAVLDTLERAERAAFRRLAAALSVPFTAGDGAAALSVDEVTGRLLMVRLADAHLVEEAGETLTGDRLYHFHVLVRAYAGERYSSAGRDIPGGRLLPTACR